MQLSPIAPIGTALITVLIGLIGFTQRRSLLSKLFAIDVAAIATCHHLPLGRRHIDG